MDSMRDATRDAMRDATRDAIRDAIRFESFNFVFFSQDSIRSLRDSIRDAMRDAMRDAIRFFASLIASLKLRDAKFLADRIPRANFRDATEGCDPIASLIMHSLSVSPHTKISILQS